MFDLNVWLIALTTLLFAGALTWLVSVAQRNVTIVDSLWPLLFILAALPLLGWQPRQPAQPAFGKLCFLPAVQESPHLRQARALFFEPQPFVFLRF